MSECKIRRERLFLLKYEKEKKESKVFGFLAAQVEDSPLSSTTVMIIVEVNKFESDLC